jgi:hypothetical protein
VTCGVITATANLVCLIAVCYLTLFLWYCIALCFFYFGLFYFVLLCCATISSILYSIAALEFVFSQSFSCLGGEALKKPGAHKFYSKSEGKSDTKRDKQDDKEPHVAFAPVPLKVDSRPVIDLISFDLLCFYLN